MGHLINPISTRLGINTFWSQNWVVNNNYKYTNIYKSHKVLVAYLRWFENKINNVQHTIKIYNSSCQYRTNNKIYINIEYYQSFGSFQIINRSEFNKQINYIWKHLISFLFWYLLTQTWKLIFEKINFQPKNLSYYFNITKIDQSGVNINVITNYIVTKLRQKQPLPRVLFPVFKDLETKIKRNRIVGYKITCSGRFTRKQIATYTWNKLGSLKLNKFSDVVKYSSAKVRLKYGVCGIKVWLNYHELPVERIYASNQQLTFPFLNFFSYTINLKSNLIKINLNTWSLLLLKSLLLKNATYSLYIRYLKFKIIQLLFVLNKSAFDLYNLKLVNSNTLICFMQPTNGDNSYDYIYE